MREQQDSGKKHGAYNQDQAWTWSAGKQKDRAQNEHRDRHDGASGYDSVKQEQGTKIRPGTGKDWCRIHKGLKFAK